MKKHLIVMCLFFCFLNNILAQKEIENIYTHVEEMPIFNGGEGKMLAYLSKNLIFSQEAKQKNVNSRVVIQFIVKEDGSIEHSEIIKSSNSTYLDKLIIKTINEMPPWIAGKHKGEKVKVRMQLPINICFQ